MKRCITAVLLYVHCIQADTVALELSRLHDELEQLSKELPSYTTQPSISPAAFLQQIQQSALLRPTKPAPSITVAQQAQDKLVADLAKKYRAYPGVVRKIIAEVAGPHELQKIQTSLDISNNDAWLPLKEIKRRLNLNLERQGSRILTGAPIVPDIETIVEGEEPESPKRVIITSQDKADVEQLAQDILKHFKKEFPALTIEDARNIAQDLFETRVVTKWSIRNRTAEQAAVKFIKELLKDRPQTPTTIVQPEQTEQRESITQKEQQENIAAIMARRSSETSCADDWET